MAGKIEQAEWRADCLKARMDAFAAADADDAGKTYTEIRKRAERRGWEATVTTNGVTVSNGAKTKTVRTHAELEAFMGTRGDAEDPCWEGYEQRGTKEKGGKTVPNCVEADADADLKAYTPKTWKNGWSRDKEGFMTGPGNPDGGMRTWWVEGTKQGKAQPRIEVQARNHNEAVTIGSKKHMLVVTGAGLKT